MGTGAFGWDFTRDVCTRALRLVRAFCLVAAPLVVLAFVRVSIAQGGVACALPRTIMARDLAELERRMDADERAAVEAVYAEPDYSGLRRLAGRPGDLAPSSAASHAMVRALCREGALPAGYGTASRLVLARYEAQGYDQREMLLSQALQAARSLVGCVALATASSHGIRALADEDLAAKMRKC